MMRVDCTFLESLVNIWYMKTTVFMHFAYGGIIFMHFAYGGIIFMHFAYGGVIFA